MFTELNHLFLENDRGFSPINAILAAQKYSGAVNDFIGCNNNKKIMLIFVYFAV